MNEYDRFLRVYIALVYRLGAQSGGSGIAGRRFLGEKVQTRATPDPFEEGRGVFLRGVFSTGI
jgi:hypothetical protein